MNKTDPSRLFLEELYNNGTIAKETYERVSKGILFTSGADMWDTPHIVTEDIREILGLTELPPEPYREKKPFWKISTIYCGNRSEKTHLFALQKIGQKEGFRAEHHPICSDWMRDASYPIAKKQLLVPALISKEQMSEIKYKAIDLCRIPPERKTWTHLGFLGEITGATVHNQFRVFIDMNMGFSDLSINFSELYFQGGNILKAENRQGEKCQLIGAYNVVASHHLLGKEIEEIKKLFHQSFEGNVIFCGLDRFEQLSYHLDISMLPLMGGKVLIQDHDESVKILTQLLKSSKISSDDKAQFKLYLVDAGKLAKLNREKLCRLKDELRASGFDPISVSGNYYIDGVGTVNYLNSIHGYGDDDHSFTLTYAYATPGEKFLRGLFTHQLHQHGVEHVYYIPSVLATEMLHGEGGLRCDTLDLE